MAIGKVKAAFISVAGAIALSACATTHDMNKDTCVKTDIMTIKDDVAKILGVLFPRLVQMPFFSHQRPVAPCNDSEVFMALVDIAMMPENRNNHHTQEAVIALYNEYEKEARGQNHAAKAINFMDEKLKLRNLTIDDFRKSYEENRPKTLAVEQQNACWNAVVRVDGQLVDQRVCGMNGFLPKPAVQ